MLTTIADSRDISCALSSGIIVDGDDTLAAEKHTGLYDELVSNATWGTEFREFGI